MGIGMIQPIHLLLIVATMLLICAAFVGTAMFLIRYAQRQSRAASAARRERG